MSSAGSPSRAISRSPRGLLFPDFVTPSELTYGDLTARLEHVLESEVRPILRAEGGDLLLVGIDLDRIAQVRLLGACGACASAVPALVLRIETIVKERLPEIRFIEAVP